MFSFLDLVASGQACVPVCLGCLFDLGDFLAKLFEQGA